MAMASDVDSDSMASEVTSDSMANEVDSDGMASEVAIDSMANEVDSDGEASEVASNGEASEVASDSMSNEMDSDSMESEVDSDGEASEVDSDGEASEVDSDSEADDGQEIEIKPIRSPVARHLCFSVCRDKLFKKATELCALTGAQLAIVVFSPAGRPHSFAHPSVNAVIERYCDPSPSAAAAAGERGDDAPDDPVRGFDSECERLRAAIAEEERRRDELDAAARAAGVWTSDDVLGRGMPDLVAALAALERMQAEVTERTHEMFADEATKVQVQWYAAVTGASDALDYDLRDQGGMDTQTVTLLGGNVDSHAAHAPLIAFPPTTTMLPPDLLPPPPLQQQLDAAFQRLRL